MANERMEIGDLIYKHLRDTVHFETAEWATARAERIAERLQREKPRQERIRVELPWLEEMTAFTAPGRYIFFSRRLFEMCWNDEMAALVVAHELGHHHLGHVRTFPDWIANITGDEIAILLSSLYRSIGTRIYSPENECEADRYGLRLCIDSGYEAEKCLVVFDVLEKHALDTGDLGMALGPEESDDELAAKASLTTRLKIWLYQRQRGYLPIRDRRKMLTDYLNEFNDEGQVPPEPKS